MSGHIAHAEVTRFLKTALECSLYVAPIDPGLTHAELVEAATRAGFLAGEIGDAIPHATTMYVGRVGDKLLSNKTDLIMLSTFHADEEPDYRNPAAFHFVFEQLRLVVRSQGAMNAKIEWGVLVERGASEGFSRSDVEIAMSILVQNDTLTQKDGIVRFVPGKESYGSPGDIRNVQAAAGRPRIRNEMRARAYPIVKDIIDRRTDDRARSAESLTAFAEQLDRLGYAAFRMWWMQLVSELRHTSIQVSPVSVTVLAAALVEGALTFAVQHGRSLGVGLFASTDFDRAASNWSIKDLVNSAAASRTDPILDHAAKHRAVGLIQARQRIHAGRMLSDFPKGVPDLRPEEADDATTTAKMIVRRVLDWLERHPGP